MGDLDFRRVPLARAAQLSLQAAAPAQFLAQHWLRAGLVGLELPDGTDFTIEVFKGSLPLVCLPSSEALKHPPDKENRKPNNHQHEDKPAEAKDYQPQASYGALHKVFPWFHGVLWLPH